MDLANTEVEVGAEHQQLAAARVVEGSSDSNGRDDCHNPPDCHPFVGSGLIATYPFVYLARKTSGCIYFEGLPTDAGRVRLLERPPDRAAKRLQ